MPRFPINAIRILSLIFSLCLTSSVFPQGSLTPPAAPAPTMKTLDQIEPRTRIPGGTTQFTISASGSYYLSGNLSIASGSSGIVVLASNVTLDLGGFELVATGGGNGVIIGTGEYNITIRNGTMRNFITRGIDGVGNTGMRVENVRVLNCNVGIEVDDDAAVIDCLAQANGGAGIVAKDKCVIRNCQAIDNSGTNVDGIFLGNAAYVSGCVARGNSRDGISVGDDAVLDSCVSSANSGHGFNMFSHCTVVNCTASGNTGPGIEAFDHIVVTATTVGSNSNIGIYINSGVVKNCTVSFNAFTGVHNFGNNPLDVIDCEISNNGNEGIFSDGASRIEGNNLTRHGTGLHVTSAGNLIIRNSGRANTTNYDIAAGNTVGPTVTSANIATSNNPHSNYDF